MQAYQGIENSDYECIKKGDLLNYNLTDDGESGNPESSIGENKEAPGKDREVDSDSRSVNKLKSPLDGIWIKSPCIAKAIDLPESSKAHDLIIYYIPNFALIGSGSHFYTEYLMTLHSLLLFQGFKNPAIFIPQLPKLPSREAKFPLQLKNVILGYLYLTSNFPKANVIIAGDSSGANLILSFLLFRSNPNYDIFDDSDEEVGAESEVYVDYVWKSLPISNPFAVILISPVLKFGSDDSHQKLYEDTCKDFLSSEIIKILSENYIPKKYQNDPFNFLHSPGYCNNSNIWEKAFPKTAVLITYGKEELTYQELRDFSALLAISGRTKIWEKKHSVHSWPFVNFAVESDQEKKEDSAFVIAGIISRMSLWYSDDYLTPDGAIEPMNTLTIDDSHI